MSTLASESLQFPERDTVCRSFLCLYLYLDPGAPVSLHDKSAVVRRDRVDTTVTPHTIPRDRVCTVDWRTSKFKNVKLLPLFQVDGREVKDR